MVSHHLWCLFPLTGAEKAWKQLRGARGGCVWEVLTNSSRNRALLQSFPPMSVNFDASRFLVRLGKKCFTYKCLCIRGGGCKTSHHWFPVSQPFSPAVLAGSVLAHVPWLCCPTFGWTPAAETYQAANRYITHRLKPFCLPREDSTETTSRAASSAVEFRAPFEGRPKGHGSLPKTTWPFLPSSTFLTQVSGCGLPGTHCPHQGTWHHPSTEGHPSCVGRELSKARWLVRVSSPLLGRRWSVGSPSRSLAAWWHLPWRRLWGERGRENCSHASWLHPLTSLTPTHPYPCSSLPGWEKASWTPRQTGRGVVGRETRLSLLPFRAAR